MIKGSPPAFLCSSKATLIPGEKTDSRRAQIIFELKMFCNMTLAAGDAMFLGDGRELIRIQSSNELGTCRMVNVWIAIKLGAFNNEVEFNNAFGVLLPLRFFLLLTRIF